MEALAIHPGSRGVKLTHRPEPELQAPDQIKLEVLRVGVCGTDREEASGGRARAPDGRADLVIGHEMLGRVVEVGSEVRRFRTGDLAVLTIRRGCGACLPCDMHRSDMCLTGRFREHGIDGLDGFQTRFVVDHEAYAVRLPPELEPIGVLVEPLSIVEKAIDEALRVQFARLPAASATPDWLAGRHCLVAGLGPVGLLAAVALTLRGAVVFGMDIVDADTPRPRWLQAIGGRYFDARRVSPKALADSAGAMELVFEATGDAEVALRLLDALCRNGVYVLTGIPGGRGSVRVEASELMRRMVLDNQLMVGSVNASRGHFQMAVRDLVLAHCRWPRHVDRLITHRRRPEDAAEVLLEHPREEIKAVVEWSRS